MLYVYIIHYILKYVKYIIRLHSLSCAFLLFKGGTYDKSKNHKECH